jgi:hypothetical protein
VNVSLIGVSGPICLDQLHIINHDRKSSRAHLSGRSLRCQLFGALTRVDKLTIFGLPLRAAPIPPIEVDIDPFSC